MQMKELSKQLKHRYQDEHESVEVQQSRIDNLQCAAEMDRIINEVLPSHLRVSDTFQAKAKLARNKVGGVDAVFPKMVMGVHLLVTYVTNLFFRWECTGFPNT